MILSQISQNNGQQHSPLLIRQMSFDYSSDEYKVGSSERDSPDSYRKVDKYDLCQESNTRQKYNPLIINKGIPPTRNRQSEKNIIKLPINEEQKLLSVEFINLSSQIKTDAQYRRKSSSQIKVLLSNIQNNIFSKPQLDKTLIALNNSKEISYGLLSPIKIYSNKTKSNFTPNVVINNYEQEQKEQINLQLNQALIQSDYQEINQNNEFIELQDSQNKNNNITINTCSIPQYNNITQHTYNFNFDQTHHNEQKQHQQIQQSIQLDQTQIENISQEKVQTVQTPAKSEKVKIPQRKDRRKSLRVQANQNQINLSLNNSGQKESTPPKSIKEDQTNVYGFKREGSISVRQQIVQRRRIKLVRAVSNDLTSQFIGIKKRKKQKCKDKSLLKQEVEGVQVKRIHSNYNESSIKLFNIGNLERVESNLSQQSLDSQGRKSCISNDLSKSLRKSSLTGNKVRFNKDIVGEYNEEDEQAIHDKNRKIFKKNHQSSQDELIAIQVQSRPKKVTIIRGSDYVAQVPYNKQYIQDKPQHKLFLAHLQQCKQIRRQLKNDAVTGLKLKEYQQKLCKNARLSQYNKQNKNLQDMKNEIKQKCKKTIVFHLESTLLQIIIKKNELQGYDASAYVKLIGKSQLKLYLNYRPYLREMLNELRKDFELILYGIKETQYIEQIGATLQKDEQIFDYLIPREMLLTHKESGVQTLDLNILLGSRELKDIIVVSHSLEKHLLHTSNAVPIKEYIGSKKDLSFYALTKYLKTYRDVIDVRTKIAEDFHIQN